MGRAKAGAKGKQRQPGKPKRATSAYLYFLSHLRDQLKAQGKSIKIGELAKEAAMKWHAMDSDTRKPFDEQALADKRRYEQEMGVFKPARDPNKPKRPSTAYFHFLADFRQKMKGSDIGHKDVIRQAGQAWQRLSEAQKHPYQVKQQEEQVEYEKKMSVYRANLPSAAMIASAAVANNGHMEEEDDEDEEEYSDEEA
jgi:hypothetical protein